MLTCLCLHRAESMDGAATRSIALDPLASRRHGAEHGGIGRRDGLRPSLGHPRLDARHRPQPRRHHRAHPPATLNLIVLCPDASHQLGPTGTDSYPFIIISFEYFEYGNPTRLSVNPCYPSLSNQCYRMNRLIGAVWIKLETELPSDLME